MGIYNKKNGPDKGHQITPTLSDTLKDLTNLRYIVIGHLRNQYGPLLYLYENGIILNVETNEQYLGFSNKWYYYVNKKYVHRLIAENFLITVKRPDQKYIDHIDGNKHNNDVLNLRWVNQSENMKNEISNKKSSESHIGLIPGNYGKHVYNNGVVNKYFYFNDEIPKEFKPGMKPRK